MIGIKNRPNIIFNAEEFTEPIFWIYGMLEDAVMHQCDTFVLDNQGFSWYKRGEKVGEFKTYGMKPTPSFQETLKLIINRDVLISNLLVLHFDSIHKSIYDITIPSPK